MAAMIAITLYMEMPRVAFEAQRRRKNCSSSAASSTSARSSCLSRQGSGYAGHIEELESFNNMRFLRRRLHRSDDRQGRVAPGSHSQRHAHRFGERQAGPTGDQSQKQADTTAGQYVGEQSRPGTDPQPAGRTEHQPGAASALQRQRGGEYDVPCGQPAGGCRRGQPVRGSRPDG